MPRTVPINVFDGAQPADNMFNFIMWLTCAVLVAVMVVQAIFMVRYRYRPGRRSVFIHGNNALESVWTLIPTLILAVIAVLSQDSWSKMKYAPEKTDDEPIHINIVAGQFEWVFHYPGPDGKLGRLDPERMDPTVGTGDLPTYVGLDPNDEAGADDVFVLDALVVPVDRTVIAQLTSVDVIHSFFMPNFRVKQDAVPGLSTTVWFSSRLPSADVMGVNTQSTLTAMMTGDPISYGKPFDIICAELCGANHYQMNGKLYVVQEAQYNKYLEDLYEANSGGGDDDYGY